MYLITQYLHKLITYLNYNEVGSQSWCLFKYFTNFKVSTMAIVFFRFLFFLFFVLYICNKSLFFEQDTCRQTIKRIPRCHVVINI